MNKINNLSIILILTVALVTSAVNVSMASSAELSTSESSFLAEVIKLDLEKYTMTKYIAESNSGYFADFGDLPKEEGDYVLKGDRSEIDVMYTLVNNTFSYFNLYLNEGSPIFTEQPSTNLIERTDAFLENYQKYLGNSEFQQYREILSIVSEVKDTAITVGNVRFEITHFSSGTKFRWVNTFNGADYTRFSISYRNNGDFAFSDDRYNKIGSTTLNVSKEQAIAIAMERVQNISWNVNTTDSSIVEVGNVTILDDRTSVALLTAPKEPLVLYPYWQVGLTFDKVYPGSVYGVTYNIWADTGEVFYGHMHMLGGLIPPEETDQSTHPIDPPTEPPIKPLSVSPPTETPPEETPTELPTESLPAASIGQTSLDFTPILIAVPIILAIILGVTFYRRKKNNSH